MPEHTLEEKVAALREMYGSDSFDFMTSAFNWNFEDVIKEHFAKDTKEFYDNMLLAIDRMPVSPQRRAIVNALGLGGSFGETLGARRQAFALKSGISERTVIRHEQAGASLLLQHHEQVKSEGASPTSSTSSGQVAKKAKTQSLETRVGKLEKHIAELTEIVSSLRRDLRQMALPSDKSEHQEHSRSGDEYDV